MKLVTFDDIKKLNINPVEYYHWVSKMIAKKSLSQLPSKISMHPANGVFCNVMPCIITETVLGNVEGVKVVSLSPDI